MHKSELPASPDLSVPAIPVICDKCGAAGMAGDDLFSAIPDILNFTPVQRRAHVNGWKEEHQRAFIAAVAITGSPRQAARAIGKHQFGADQLRNHRTGKSFAAAWDAAMDLAREREIHRIRDNLAGLAESSQANQPTAHPERSAQRAVEGHPDCNYDPDIHTADYPEYWDTQRRIRHRLTLARRLLLFLISQDEEKRRAWETLCGPVDWDRAERREPQDDEPFFDPDDPGKGPSMTRPDMLLTAEAGLLPDRLGGVDAVAEAYSAAIRANDGEADAST